MNKSHRIGIDCRLSGLRHAGIGRYTENLVRSILSLPKSKLFSWVLFFHDEEQLAEVLKPIDKKLLQNVETIITPIQHYSFKEQMKLPHIFSAQQLDILHIPHFNIPVTYSGKLIITIHDLLWHEQKGSQVTTLKGWKYWPKYLGYRFIVSRALSKASVILVPAETIKSMLSKKYQRTSNKIIVTKEGIDETYKSSFSITTATKKQFVYTGSLYPHKNISLVLRALKENPEYSLYIVGSRSVFQDRVRKEVDDLSINSQVVFTGYLPDAELIQLYHESTALVQPSLSEGFGLPGLEALATGTPVLCSDIPIFKEIYQDAVYYFNPHSVDSFLNAVKEIEILSREKIAKKGKKIADSYSWISMASQTLEIYQKNIHP